ncbi:hypothetical protein HZC34_07520 [Candidatus Saganbacteria bacterium]|nr:hypothetical protein [Candidatus Saganbacteria bacterium]
MLAKVPANIQVRLLHPLPEESVPHIIVEEKNIPKTNPIISILKRFFHGAFLSVLIGLSMYGILKLVGIEFGGLVETSIFIFFPAFLGFLTSYVIY